MGARNNIIYLCLIYNDASDIVITPPHSIQRARSWVKCFDYRAFLKKTSARTSTTRPGRLHFK
jgi:hypothetical protein